MKLLISILFLFCVVLAGAQGPGHYQNFPLPDYYGAGGTASIGIYFPYDSTARKHPLILSGNGQGEQGNQNNADSSLGWLVSSTNWTGRTTNTAKGGTSTFIVGILHVTIGGMDYRWYKNMYRYMTTVWGSRVDNTQISMQGLSLSGGAVFDFLDQAADSMAIWTSRISCFATGAGASPNFAYNPRILANINTYNIHLRVYYCADDNSAHGGNDFSASQNLNLASLSRGFSPGNTYTYKPDLVFKMTGNHNGGWSNLMTDTLHRSWLADSSVEHGGNSAWQNKSYNHNPNGFEWQLQFQKSTGATNIGPVANAGADQTIYVPATTATLNGSASYDPDGTNLAYQWTKLSGPSGGTTSSTSVTAGLTSLQQGTYSYRLRVTDDSSAIAYDTVNVTVQIRDTILTLTDASGKPLMDILDPSGYVGDDQNTPYNFFDANGTADPWNGVTTDTTSIGNPAHGWPNTTGTPQKDNGPVFPDSLGSNNGIKYPGTGRAYIIVSLNNLKKWEDTTHRLFVITGIAAQCYSVAGLKMRTYDYQNVWRAPIDVRDSVAARFDETTPMIDSFVSDGFTHNWIYSTAITAAHPLTTRYLAFTFEHNGTHNISDFTEIVIKGHWTSGIVDSMERKVPDIYKIPFVKPDSLIGYTTFTGNQTSDYSNDAGVRSFVQIGGASPIVSGVKRNDLNNTLDTTDAPGIPKRFRNALAEYPSLNFAWMRALEAAGKRVYLTFHAANTWNANHHYTFVNTDDTTKDPRRWKSYYRSAFTSFKVAALFGDSVLSNADTAWQGMSDGQNVAKRSSFANENNAHGYCLMCTVIKSSADFDGHEGRMGAAMGVQNADKHFELVGNPDYHANINTVKVVSFASALLRNDHHPPMHKYEVHLYGTIFDSLPRLALGFSQQAMGVRSEMMAKLYSKNKLNYVTFWHQFIGQFYSYMPSDIQIILGEWGGDNWDTATATVGEAGAIHTQYASTRIGKWSGIQAKGVRSSHYYIAQGFIHGLSETYQYNKLNQPTGVPNDTTNKSPQFFSAGEFPYSDITPPYAAQHKFPVGYIKANYLYLVKGFVQDTLIQADTLTPWHAIYRDRSNSSHVRHVFFRPGDNADSSFYSCSLPNLTSVKEYTFSLTNDKPDSVSNLTVTSGTLSRRVSALPVVYDGVETYNFFQKFILVRRRQ